MIKDVREIEYNIKQIMASLRKIKQDCLSSQTRDMAIEMLHSTEILHKYNYARLLDHAKAESQAKPIRPQYLGGQMNPIATTYREAKE